MVEKIGKSTCDHLYWQENKSKHTYTHHTHSAILFLRFHLKRHAKLLDTQSVVQVKEGNRRNW